MVKILLLIVGVISFSSAFAAGDSVAIFHRPEKVVVLLNENYTSNRIQQLLDLFEFGNELLLQTADGKLKIQCRTTAQAASCNFRFFPGSSIKISPQGVQAEMALSDLQVPLTANHEMIFESATQDRFILRIFEGAIYFTGQKR